VVFEVEKSFEADVLPLVEAIQSGCCGDSRLLLRFLRDLLTPEEGKMFSQRWRIAQLLLEGKKPKEITAQTTATHVLIGKVKNFACGSYGTGGYREVYDNLHRTTGEDPDNEKGESEL
jgi:uncharacterized protein YerC